ncbi:MAG: hypothetical protein JO267_14290 [Alphaproteobacteria bacterium]|nr:hypothetical protein [Alphaproteobacteria bacterium]
MSELSGLIAQPAHEVAYQDLCALINKHAAKVSALELLAIAANVVGKMIALQDQRMITTEAAMRTVAKNIEVGNQQVLEQLAQTAGQS